jgi:hypothetical protein
MLARGDSLLVQDMPPGILPCVWMSAGLVSFKLCDREGECEGCPFDRAMMGRGPTPTCGPASHPLVRGAEPGPSVEFLNG